MIRKPTILIFGAGVSFEYGFPLGRSLLPQIVDELKKDSWLRLGMKACGFTYSVIDQFQHELNLSGQPSVDSFLEQHNGEAEVVRLGKAAIAASLIPCEQAFTLNDRSTLRLYEYLWHQMSGGPKMYSGNQLSILTFNYDRSFEQYLRTVLKASHPEFRGGGQEFTQALSQFSVTHLYGSLGSLDPASRSHLPYGSGDSRPSPEAILASAERIKLYHEAKFDDQTLEPLRSRMSETETICFLGFGFHPINMRILQFCGLGENGATKHFASAYRLKPGQRTSVSNLVKFNIEFANEQATSLEALQILPVLAAK